VAFADSWQGNGLEPDKWRDLMFKTSGIMTRSVQDVFASLWRESSGELLAGDDFYPPQSESSGDRTALFTHLFHTPNPDLNQGLAQLLWLSIHSSKERIRIETPYLLPLDATYEAIIEKAREGVLIEIIVPGDKTDAPFVRAAARSYYRELLDAGVHIYEYQPALFHTKTIVADGVWSLIGSANLDSRSSILNVENVMGVVDPVLAAELEAIFEVDKSRSHRIDPETWEQGFFERMLGYVSRFFVKQY
jgi:cardiolipin synthase